MALAVTAGGCASQERQGTVAMLDGDFQATILGSEADGFASPDGLVWRNGALLMADEGGPALRRWTPGETAVTLADSRSGLASPEDLAIGGDGAIFHTDDDIGGLWRTDGSGTRLVAGPESGLASTEGIAIAPDGSVLVGDQRAHRIVRVDREGGVSSFAGAAVRIEKPESMVFDDRGDLYVADNSANILYRFMRDGSSIRLIEGRADFSPESIAHWRGMIFITDSENGSIYRFSRQSGLDRIAVFTGDLVNVNGIAVDDRGAIYVTVQADLARGRGYVVRLAPRQAMF